MTDHLDRISKLVHYTGPTGDISRPVNYTELMVDTGEPISQICELLNDIYNLMNAICTKTISEIRNMSYELYKFNHMDFMKRYKLLNEFDDQLSKLLRLNKSDSIFYGPLVIIFNLIRGNIVCEILCAFKERMDETLGPDVKINLVIEPTGKKKQTVMSSDILMILDIMAFNLMTPSKDINDVESIIEFLCRL
jgi:hypothetical protein